MRILVAPAKGQVVCVEHGLPRTYWRLQSGHTSSQDFAFLEPLKPTVVFETYWRFAAERQAIFFRRLEGRPAPWTDDPILQQHKFTNAYRASDRVSQYLIRHVIYEGDPEPEEVFFRTLLFKLFNRIETWNTLKETVGEIRYRTYAFSAYDSALSSAVESGERIYSPAYIMPSGGRIGQSQRKHQMHLKLLERMMANGLPRQIQRARSMEEVFGMLCAYPTIGDFLAYQYAADLNYSPLTNFDEMEFVVPGPGAKDGIRKCFSDLGGTSASDTIRAVTERQDKCFATLAINFTSLWGRPLQLIDCQNLFCEVGKYARVKHPEFVGITKRARIKQRFRPKPEIVCYWYPPKWNLNQLIEEGVPGVFRVFEAATADDVWQEIAENFR